MRCGVALIHRLVLFVPAVALSFIAATAARALNFDGKTDAAVLSGGQALLGRDIGVLQFRVARDAKSQKGPILEMQGASTGFSMGFTDDGTGLLFVSAAGEYTISPPGFSDATPHLFTMQLLYGSGAGPG